jgi:hypothetical protein
MVSSNDLRDRLQKFLADPQTNGDFRLWFASLLADVRNENSVEVESLVHAIHLAFSDAAEGLYTPEQLREHLAELAKPEKGESAPATYIVAVRNGPVFFGYSENISQSSCGVPSASGAFYSQVPTSQGSSFADKAQPTAWETLVVPASPVG